MSALKDNNGVLHSNHQDKANILWSAFKERLGVQEYRSMLFDLHDLFTVPNDLSCLEEPLSHEEIDQVVAQLSTDKSPSPDGFNIDFIKNDGP